MKGLSIFVTITLLIFNYLHAQSVLAAVKINDQEQLQLWHDLSYSSYAFFENTVISEVSHSDVLVLEGQNFHCLIIDEAPWTEPYFICTVPSDLELSLPGEIIWHSNRIYLIKLPKNRISELKNIPVKFKQLTKSTLPDRFWTGMDTKVVPVQSVQWDPFIQSLVDQVNTDSLTSYIQRLQDFRTRLMLSDSSYAASAWLRQKFTSWGYAAEFDSFYLDLEWPGVGYERNVIATIDGTIAPSKIFIIGGHVDSYVTDTAIARVYAPGADDNASSVAAVLEAARILKGYTWKKTIKFMGWNGEEMGCHGSDHYAAYAESLGLDIGGVINLDMIGYMDDASLDCNIMRCHSFSQWLSDLFYQVGQVYTPSLLLYQETWAAGWDDYSFAIRGYPAICGSERWWYNNFHVHDTTDVLSEMFPLLYTSVTKVAVATVALLGLYPGMVEDVVVFDAGNGGSLVVNWSANYESDVVGYKVYWGRQSEMYTDTHFVAGLENTTDTLTGLMADSIYYVAVNAVDVDSRESYLATEVTGIPRAIPLTPAGVIATPIISGVRIDWEPNQELDFAGYRVYRRVNDDPVYDSLNSVLLPDTTFTNAPLSGANKYYYAVRAFDMDGNASPMSSEVYGRPITLDQGIVIVDETRNSPFPPNPPPPDSLQDAFYQYILEGYRYTECDFDSLVQGLVLADFVAYSTVLWHADDYSEHMAEENVEALRDYLDVGGRLWFVGWRPASNLSGIPVYPIDFSPGDFMYDYLKIAQVDVSAMSDSFQAGIGLLGYPGLDVDTAKVPVANWGGTLRFIEAYASVAPGEDIYTIDMKNNSSPFEGAVCGVRYLGNDFKTVFFGFPLYFMDEEQARAAAQQVMFDFGELYVAEEPKDGVLISGLSLSQNVPNPFMTKTAITYQIAHAGQVSLRVYNIAGRLVRTLVGAPHHPGVYTIVWDGRDNEGTEVSSGVYFYRLEMSDHGVVKKMTLLR